MGNNGDSAVKMPEAQLFENDGYIPILTGFVIEGISIAHRSQLQTYHLEDGSVMADDKTIQPILITVEGSVGMDDYMPTVGDIENMLKTRKYKFYRLVMRNGVLEYGNLCLENMPLYEKPDMMDRVHIRLVFKMMMIASETKKLDAWGNANRKSETSDAPTMTMAMKGAH